MLENEYKILNDAIVSVSSSMVQSQKGKKIAEIKMPDLNAYDLKSAMNTVAGTARNMGIAVKGLNDAELAEQVKEAAEAEAQAAKLEADLEEMEESAKALAEGTNVEVEVTHQDTKEETESEE